MRKLNTYILLMIIALLLTPAAGICHKVILFAWVEKGMIHSESSFGSDRKAQNCIIKAMDDRGSVVHQGKTDENGEYTFPVPEGINGDLILILEAGTGHQARWTIKKEEMLSDPGTRELETAMEKKKELNKGPSVLKIVSGIAAIFVLAFLVRQLKGKSA